MVENNETVWYFQSKYLGGKSYLSIKHFNNYKYTLVIKYNEYKNSPKGKIVISSAVEEKDILCSFIIPKGKYDQRTQSQGKTFECKDSVVSVKLILDDEVKIKQLVLPMK